jgi:hypothetical protein
MSALSLLFSRERALSSLERESLALSAHISPMWSINLNKENGGKRRTWVQKRKKERKRRKLRKERTTHETDVHLWMFYPNNS